MFRGFDKINSIGIAGAGTIGGAWAAYFLAKGFDVHVADSDAGVEARVNALVEAAWPKFERLGWIAAGAGLDRLNFHTSFAELTGVDFVQESVFEKLEVKRQALRELDAVLPADVIISSSTSGLLVSDMQQGLTHAARVLIGHPMNPPHLIPLVEIVGGDQTDPEAVREATNFYNAIGKRAVVLNKPVIGHLATRLTVALWREAAFLVASGVASAEDVDAAVVYGPGLRSAIAGPHLSYHMGGGENGLAGFFAWAKEPLKVWAGDLGAPEINDALIEALVLGVNRAVGDVPIKQLADARDADLIAVLGALEGRQLT
ncbi:3-hydroxyacyl-CoA dehydrogenase NAD-binding domain-containing protein [Devosia naphthalenivorans]|uniref:3-hydroxyacyl-CoA dehydrogenase NAD-binding domain-containing protein n=1 Tax=Devosia naphthalenivorans TaxID=2082392 RepID=UPI000D346830|nr:3-hydroxyacyl-CoA dehydrogenase NAD-binding domain-containing protein [Devosia naphthalenivorans]